MKTELGKDVEGEKGIIGLKIPLAELYYEQQKKRGMRLTAVSTRTRHFMGLEKALVKEQP